MIQKKVRILGMLSAMLCCGAVSAQQHEVEMIPFGNMDQWIDRQIKGIRYYWRCHEECICHQAYCYYHRGPRHTKYGRFAVGDIQCDGPPVSRKLILLFPGKARDGFCARMDTRMESVKVLE